MDIENHIQAPAGNNEDKFEKWFIQCYPKSADAFLVVKYFGNLMTAYSGNNLGSLLRLLLEGKEQQLLELAKNLEEESKKN